MIGSLFGDKDTQKKKLPKEYEWVVGIWTCSTPYGTMTYSLMKNGAFSDNEGHKGTFSVEDGRIYTHLDGTLGFAIEVDEVNHRIRPGDGYWMQKMAP